MASALRAHLVGVGADEEVGAGARDEVEGVVARLHVLPKVVVAVVEDVIGAAQVAVVLRREHLRTTVANLMGTPSVARGLTVPRPEHTCDQVSLLTQRIDTERPQLT